LSKYSFEPVEDDVIWDDIAARSEESTLFTDSDYLNAFGGHYDCYEIKKGNQTKAGVCVVINGEKSQYLNDLVIYSGILFIHDHNQKPVKLMLERFDLTTFIIDELVQRYRRIEFALSPMTIDVRPFLWHNYHSDDIKQKFTVDIRYTSYLNISSLRGADSDQETELFRGMENLRQRNVREAKKYGVITESSQDTTKMIDYYKTLMNHQGVSLDENKLNNMHHLIDMILKEKKGQLYLSKRPDGTPLYITMFGWDSHRAYYLFGAPNPETNERYKGTICFWHAFIDLASRGIDEIDMEGVNSPKRGWFKLSFGGDIRPYYRVMKDGSNAAKE
jgi:hypothetical protein